MADTLVTVKAYQSLLGRYTKTVRALDEAKAKTAILLQELEEAKKWEGRHERLNRRFARVLYQLDEALKIIAKRNK